MPTVSTVLGPVDVYGLGQTLMHEHVFVVAPEHLDYGRGGWWDEEHRVADAIAKLGALAAKGVRTIVDPTVWGLGRDIPRIQRVAAGVPELNIVVATGLYAFDELPHQYEHRGPGLLLDMPDPMVDDFVRDLTEGIGGTGVKAAFLKCVVEAKGLTPGVERICRAVARAHVRTGAPVTVHTNAFTRSGTLALDVFAQEGVDLTKVVVGHAGDSNDLDHLMSLADTGAVLGMDRFGLDIYNPTPQRVATIAALCERGYADRMVLSHDTACFMDYFGGAWDEARERIAPNWRYDHIHDDVLDALREAGVSDGQIEQMLVFNPRRYFS
ncbi:phosphotriesterase family protein [Nonomuraea pusilla]|uniref:Phosphotriesterase-related protein n=1 Tax=Nonomuraea pusilla TaxID=46177 RepID=A0A1H8I4C3_9ACTN|nr:phosphotriesterase [Nonomuraea pusilla]SEN63161.1 phosphotriesterase-related protein [Nonomuraea pusilla]